MAQITLSVRGMKPIPWGSNEMAWRKFIADQARAKFGQEKWEISAQTRFSMEVMFLMKEDNIQRADLDNLAKPVLDTLFRVRYAQVKDLSRTGALFSVDDDRVFKLLLEKQVVHAADDEGIEVHMSWETD